MNSKNISKFLSLVLRHKPETIGLVLDKNGWGSVEHILDKMDITMEQLNDIVENNDKKRFILNDDKSLIRANQGHSVSVDLDLEEVNPNHNLYHGTATQHVESILKTGLNKGKRHHVHMAKDHKTAIAVGMRSGSVVIFEINVGEMIKDGHKFYVSKNGVYLTDNVPPKYLKRIK